MVCACNSSYYGSWYRMITSAQEPGINLGNTVRPLSLLRRKVVYQPSGS